MSERIPNVDIVGRLRSAFGAQTAITASRIAEQFFSVPLFLHFWGAHTYGEWLIIAAIPSLLTYSDFGVTQASSNDMAIAGGSGNISALRHAFSNMVLFLAIIIPCLFLFALIFGLAIPFRTLLHVTTINDHVARAVFIVLSFGAACSIVQNATHASLRALNRFDLGIWLAATGGFGRFLLLAFALFIGCNPFWVALAMVGGSVALTAALFVVCLSENHGLIRFQFPMNWHANIGRLAWMSVTLALVPLSSSLLLQGIIIAIGTEIGPAGVAVFNVHQILARFILSAQSIVTNPLLQQIGITLGARDVKMARRLHQRGLQTVLWMVISYGVGFACLGAIAMHLWTAGRVTISPVLMAGVLIATSLEGIGNAASIVPLGTNMHERLALFVIVARGFALAGSILLASTGSLALVPWANVVAQVVIVAVALSESCKILTERPLALIKHALTPPWFLFRFLFSRRDNSNSLPL